MTQPARCRPSSAGGGMVNCSPTMTGRGHLASNTPRSDPSTPRQAPRHRDRRLAVLWRFLFRLLVIAVFAALWPGPSTRSATAVLCLVLAVGCVLSAIAFREPLRGSGLNRWDEAAGLLIVALFVDVFF